MASTAVANPMDVRMKSRRFIPSRFAFSLPHLPIRCSTCCCFLFWGRGRISSFDKTCVGIGESTPFSASRLYLGIHIAVASFERSPTNFILSRVRKRHDISQRFRQRQPEVCRLLFACPHSGIDRTAEPDKRSAVLGELFRNCERVRGHHRNDPLESERLAFHF